MINFYKGELERCKKALMETDPANWEQYHTILHSILDMQYQIAILEHPEDPTPLPEEIEDTPTKDEPGDEATETTVDANDAPWSEPEKAPEDKPSEPEEPAMKKEDVMSILSPLAASGVNIAGVMKGMGYKRLSEIPASKYAELVANAKAAAGKGDD